MVKYLYYCLFIFMILTLSTPSILADDGKILNQKIELPKTKGSIYQLLRTISQKTGYFFIYDSQIIDNNKKTSIDKGEYTLDEAIRNITQRKDIKLRIVNKHILLYTESPQALPEINRPETPKADIPEDNKIIFGGTILDQLTGTPIPAASVGIINSSIGTVANLDGEFRLTIPDSLATSYIHFSSLGYRSQEIEVSLLSGQTASIMLEPQVIPLQEIVVRLVDPTEQVTQMLEKREKNYAAKPVYLTTFYREGVESKKKNMELTEAILKIYKTGYNGSADKDDAMLLKKREIWKKQEADTIVTKMKSGINASLTLDIIRELPDFLTLDKNFPYIFAHTDITTIDDRRVNVISFEQNEYVYGPLYQGELYIDAENHALLKAVFKINPKFVKSAVDTYIVRKKRDMSVTLEGVTYEVTYKPINGVYYVSHIRGDLNFRIRKKRKLFSAPFHTWFEMVVCEIDTENVSRFSREEKVSTHNIFSNVKFEYDSDFWGNFNTIMPEENLKKAIADYFSNNR